VWCGARQGTDMAGRGDGRRRPRTGRALSRGQGRGRRRLESTGSGGAGPGQGRRRPAGGGRARANWGEMSEAGSDPCWSRARRGEAGWNFRPSSALLSREARFELLTRAGPRDLFQVRWAVPK
jgi:hypothetical protein